MAGIEWPINPHHSLWEIPEKYKQISLIASTDVQIPPDTVPPEITKIIVDSNILQLFFDGPVELSSAGDPENYVVSNGIGLPWQVKSSLPLVITLRFGRVFKTGSYELICKRLTDESGNSVNNYTVNFDHGEKQDLLPFQLLITEMMVDPLPSVGLPAYEFVEVYNPTDHILNLAAIQLQFESNVYPMDTSVLLLNPGDYLILCETNAYEGFKKRGKAHRLRRWPAIRNTEGTVSLSQNRKIIHSISYKDSWYKDNQKKNGGWSLEMINTANVCDRQLNWKASIAPSGGTPGQSNSIAENNYLIPWRIDSLQVIDDQRIKIVLNKSISLIDAKAIEITPNLPLNSVTTDLATDGIELYFITPLKSGQVYQLELNAINCIGEISSPALMATFTKEETAEPYDMVINEILFNPVSGGSDYIEVYNKSGKVFSPEGWTLSNINNGQKRKIISTQWILPGDYIVFSTDPDYISQNYKKVKPDWLIEQSLPSLPDEEGQLSLISNTGRVIDSVNYHENMHSAFLDSKEGVSLERINPEKPGGRNNWHSASGVEGYGTPTRRNITTTNTQATAFFKLKQKIFSPDRDGYEDYLQVDYSLPAKEYLTRIYIYDDHGHLIKKLVDNLILSYQGRIEWEGTNEFNQICKTGIYILAIEALGLDGKSIKTRLTTVLAMKY